MIHLILGGARSGKSSYAESLAILAAESSNKTISYLATAIAQDDEMKARIKRHQLDRPKDWKVIEEPLLLTEKLNQLNDNNQLIIIDCMTLWITNWLCLNEGDGVNNLSSWEQEKSTFISQLKKSKATILIVSNETGSGIIPLGTLNRQFVDHAGWLNQEIAQVSQQVTLVVAGLPLELKNTSKVLN